MLRNSFTHRYDTREDDIDATARDALRKATESDDYRIAPINAGEGVGDVTGVDDAEAVIRRLITT